MSKINQSEKITLAKNKRKIRCNVFRYPSQGDLMRDTGLTASEFMFCAATLALLKMGKIMPYITDRDKLLIDKFKKVCMS